MTQKKEPGPRKTTRAEFEAFKKSFLEWQRKLGLLAYSPAFQLKKMDGRFAEIDVNHMGKIALVTLNSETDTDNIPFWNPAGSGAHEAFHLLIARISWLGHYRYTTRDEINEEDEAIVRRLEHAFEIKVKK